MGTVTRPAKTSPASWDAFCDVDVFVDDVLSEESIKNRGAFMPLVPRVRPDPRWRPWPGTIWRTGREGSVNLAAWCCQFGGRRV
jgi:hypothetical protein